MAHIRQMPATPAPQTWSRTLRRLGHSSRLQRQTQPRRPPTVPPCGSLPPWQTPPRLPAVPLPGPAPPVSPGLSSLFAFSSSSPCQPAVHVHSPAPLRMAEPKPKPQPGRQAKVVPSPRLGLSVLGMKHALVALVSWGSCLRGLFHPEARNRRLPHPPAPQGEEQINVEERSKLDWCSFLT